MSKTAQRKRQAYEEGLRHGAWMSGYAYSRHPFMAEYRKGYQDGVTRARHREVREQPAPGIASRILSWLASRFAG